MSTDWNLYFNCSSKFLKGWAYKKWVHIEICISIALSNSWKVEHTKKWLLLIQTKNDEEMKRAQACALSCSAPYKHLLLLLLLLIKTKNNEEMKRAQACALFTLHAFLLPIKKGGELGKFRSFFLYLSLTYWTLSLLFVGHHCWPKLLLQLVTPPSFSFYLVLHFQHLQQVPIRLPHLILRCECWGWMWHLQIKECDTQIITSPGATSRCLLSAPYRTLALHLFVHLLCEKFTMGKIQPFPPFSTWKSYSFNYSSISAASLVVTCLSRLLGINRQKQN